MLFLPPSNRSQPIYERMNTMLLVRGFCWEVSVYIVSEGVYVLFVKRRCSLGAVYYTTRYSLRCLCSEESQHFLGIPKTGDSPFYASRTKGMRVYRGIIPPLKTFPYVPLLFQLVPTLAPQVVPPDWSAVFLMWRPSLAPPLLSINLSASQAGIDLYVSKSPPRASLATGLCLVVLDNHCWT